MARELIERKLVCCICLQHTQKMSTEQCERRIGCTARIRNDDVVSEPGTQWNESELFFTVHWWWWSINIKLYHSNRILMVMPCKYFYHWAPIMHDNQFACLTLSIPFFEWWNSSPWNMDQKRAWKAKGVRMECENGGDVIEDDEEELWIECAEGWMVGCVCTILHNFFPARQIKIPLENYYSRRPKVKMLESFTQKKVDLHGKKNAIDMSEKWNYSLIRNRFFPSFGIHSTVA